MGKVIQSLLRRWLKQRTFRESKLSKDEDPQIWKISVVKTERTFSESKLRMKIHKFGRSPYQVRSDGIKHD
jgi:hypothetical protein